MEPTRNVAILIFDDVEVLDFAGPFEVFSVSGRRDNLEPFNVYTVAEKPGPVLARNEFSVNPKYTLENCPEPDIVLVPGGYGTRKEMNNPVIVDWVKSKSLSVEYMLSVCTGALILAKAGLLKGKSATTHHGALGLLKEIEPEANVDGTRRVVDNGNLILSAGVAAGIDMSFHVVSRIMGKDHAVETAHYIEYPWKPL